MSSAEASQFCTFFLGDQFFGVDVTKVQEIIRYQEMTQVPLTEPALQGLINLRGQIVTAIDLRRRLGFDRSPDPDKKPTNVVLRSDGGAISLLVDEIDEVVEVDGESFEEAPATLASPLSELVLGVHKLEGRLLLVLDVERTVDFDAASR